MTDPRQLLEAERASAERRLSTLRREFDQVVSASRESNADDEHDPEGATIAYERSQLDMLIAQAERQLTDVAEALGRLEAGTYGVCVTCGRPIAVGRLEARPLARTCIECAGRDRHA